MLTYIKETEFVKKHFFVFLDYLNTFLFHDWNITLKTAVKHLGFKRKYKLGKQIDETRKMI